MCFTTVAESSDASRCVAMPMMAAEVEAFVDSFGFSYIMARNMERTQNRSINVYIYTN